MVPVDGDPRARYRVLIAKKKRPDQFFHFRHTDLNSEIGKCISRQQEVGNFDRFCSRRLRSDNFSSKCWRGKDHKKNLAIENVFSWPGKNLEGNPSRDHGDKSRTTTKRFVTFLQYLIGFSAYDLHEWTHMWVDQRSWDLGIGGHS